MGHIPTVVVGILASVLTALYFILPAAVHFTVLVFISAAWFLVAICWLAQKSADYMHRGEGHEHVHEEKKKLTNYNNNQQTLQMTSSQLSQAKSELNAELDSLRSSLKNKDEEIGNLKSEISSLQTLVEIEKLKVDLANLKALAAKESAKRKK
jgi:peptidoglycan hydrolase CwlO-like protein